MLRFFLDYINNESLGRIANSHLAIADSSEKLAFDERCLELARLHSWAVDYAKTEYSPNIPKFLLA